MEAIRFEVTAETIEADTKCLSWTCEVQEPAVFFSDDFYLSNEDAGLLALLRGTRAALARGAKAERMKLRARIRSLRRKGGRAIRAALDSALRDEIRRECEARARR